MDNDELQLRNRVKLRLLLAGVDKDVVEAVDDDTPVINLHREAFLWSDAPRLTVDEIAAEVGLDVEVCRRARMLLGLPDPGDLAVCRVEEVEAFRGLAAGVEAFGAEPVLHFTRVIGSALATVAEASLSVFGRSLADTKIELCDDEFALVTFDALELFAVVPTVLASVARLQFDLATTRISVGMEQTQQGAIAFVDLSGSTEATVQLGADVVSVALSRFETRAVELAGAHGGRVVKFIGDEAMIHTATLEGAVEVAMGLVRHVHDDLVLRSARAGVASGELIGRDGDWFGTTVNRAARLVERARSGQVLLSGEGGDQIDGAIARGRLRLRDLPDRQEVWRVRVS